MLDNTIILFQSKDYAYVQYLRHDGNLGRKFVYTDGKDLKYGDKAEILGAVSGIDFGDFISGALSETHFTREHYWVIFGHQPADFDNEEIKTNEVRIHYASVDNTVTKKDFYELCILLCESKLKNLTDTTTNDNDLILIILKLNDKIKAV